jgi:hypothetical protein
LAFFKEGIMDMLLSKHSVWSMPNRSVASFALAGMVSSVLFTGFNVPSMAANIPVRADNHSSQTSTQNLLPIAFQKSVETKTSDQTLIAHHESMGLGASQLLTTGGNAAGAGGLTKSLWANLILSMAYQQDAELQAIGKKMHRLGIFTLSSIATISGLTIAQGIDGLVTLQQDPHPLHPTILGLVGSSLTLATITTQAVVGHRYKKQLTARQHEIQDQVLHVMDHLKTEGDSDHVRTNLAELIGKEAMEEFMQIWASVHH